MEGIDKQFGEYDEQMMAVGLDGQRIIYLTIELHLCGMGDQTAGVLKSLARHVVAANGVCQTDGLSALDQRSGEQLAHHIVEGVCLHEHRFGNLPLLVVGYALTIFAQHLCEAVNDVEWCTYLVRHVLHEMCLLLTGLSCQQGGLFQFRGALLGFLLCMLCIMDVLGDSAPHQTEGVLQLPDQVSALTERQGLLIVTVTDLSQLGSQQAQRLYKVFYNTVASHYQQHPNSTSPIISNGSRT